MRHEGSSDHELNRLQAASERVAANLVELEIDSGRQLLEASTLTGESLDAITRQNTFTDMIEIALETALKL